ncbi:MAG: phenylalanine--tRNA ligase subunit alpha [Acidobacteriota bacterium]|nr:phenylalanine--tRNA ligase subunit alpha [Acidobacteriota bacterium]
MYSVPKLDDYSAATLDRAAAELLSALHDELLELGPDSDTKVLRDRWIGRKNGILAQVNDLWLKAAPAEAKREVGRHLNSLRDAVAERVNKALYYTVDLSFLDPKDEKVDITLPGIRRALGAEHPVLRTMNELVAVFRAMGYSVGEGPEIETDYYNFEALNFPPNHPARDSQDTLFVAGQESKPLRERLLLRTHTSPVQIRTMEKQPPPVRIVIPGKVYRHDTPDASHSPLFHQVEGLAVDTGITFSDLKGTLDHAMKALFGSGVKTRFFPSFFPFTEPSADVAVTCFKCNGRGRIGEAPCRMCKMSGWIELLGSGMVDPAVFGFVKKNGYDPEKVSGFAFGMGVDRIAMMKYEIDDISLLFQGDVRFLEQFA